MAPLLVAATLACGALAVLATRVPPVVFVSAGVVLSVFSGHWRDIGLPTGPDRFLLVAGVAGAVYRMVRRGGPDADIGIFRLVVVLAVSVYAITSAVVFGSFEERESVFALLDKLGLIPFVVFLLAPVIFATEWDRRFFLGSLVALAAYLGIDAFLEIVGPRSLVYPRYIVDPTIGIHADRARGPFAESVGFGTALYSCVVATALWGFAVRRSRLARVFACGVIALCVLGIVGTVTRNAWLAAVVATTITLVAVPGLRRLLLPLAATATVAIGSALVVVPGLLDRATSRTESQRPLWDRYNSNRAAWNMVQDRPLLGHGWGSFRTEGYGYYQIVPDYPLTSVAQVHNVVLSHLAELGVLGCGLWLLALGTALAPVFWFRSSPSDPWRIGLIALAVNWFMTAMFAPLGYAFPNVFLWTWAGLAWVACAPAQERVRAERARRRVDSVRQRRRRPWAPAVPAVTAAKTRDEPR